MESRSVQDYLKALYKLEQRHERVSTNLLAEQLHIAPASVTAMVKKLADGGMVEYVPYQGCRLTARGQAEALRMVRRHRILEQFLHSVLHYARDEVDEEAEILEHAVSDRFIERLWQLMGQPQYDPHGAPIPDAQGRLPSEETCPLLCLKAGQKGTICPFSTCHARESESLPPLPEGIRPGTFVQLQETDQGQVRLQTDTGTFDIPLQLARHIRVKPL